MSTCVQPTGGATPQLISIGTQWDVSAIIAFVPAVAIIGTIWWHFGWYWHYTTQLSGQSRIHGTAHVGSPRGPAVTVVILLIVANSGAIPY